MKRINDIEELKRLSAKKKCKCFIQLNFGLRSSKDVKYNAKTGIFTVFNWIDATEQKLNEQELGEYTNIIKALDKGALYTR